jgi:hypothetical protein
MFALVVRFYLRDEAAAKGFDALVAVTAPLIRDAEHVDLCGAQGQGCSVVAGVL